MSESKASESGRSVRDAVAQCLQICEYIEDCATMPVHMTDWPTIVAKAKQVRAILMEKGPKL